MAAIRARSGTSRWRWSRPRWLLPILVVVVVGFLYYRPLSSYVETRSALEARTDEVVALRLERARVTRRLERVTSLETLARDARGIGFVRPGEQLFIVKGIPQWRREHRADDR
ncbi:MAG: septum formation initiator family protein [Gaiella sp.]